MLFLCANLGDKRYKHVQNLAINISKFANFTENTFMAKLSTNLPDYSQETSD